MNIAAQIAQSHSRTVKISSAETHEIDIRLVSDGKFSGYRVADPMCKHELTKRTIFQYACRYIDPIMLHPPCAFIQQGFLVDYTELMLGKVHATAENGGWIF